MQSFKRIDATTINAALQSASGAELTKTAKRIAEQPDDDDEIYAEGMTKAQLKAKYNIKGKVDRSKIRNAKKIAGMRGKALELKKAGLTEGTFVQGELANQKATTLGNKSQENALASAGGGGQPVIINNNNVDNSVQSSKTTEVSMPEPTRTNESTVRALQNG